ncbi:MAG: hypothetical protein RBS39_01015 [Phycisphaerales bacterium]|jgi:hypothetical protein|nr:hypothetical protein [Phycisphaerales bacterium]
MLLARRARVPLRALAVVAIACAAPALAQLEIIEPEREADTVARRPAAAMREVATYDFEIPPASPMLPPDGWVRAQNDPAVAPRPGFPTWNEAIVDERVAFRGVRSVRLPVYGGSTALRLIPGELPVFEQGDYRITAMTRTNGATASRARMTVRLLDAALQPIPGSERSSASVISNGSWAPLSVEVAGGTRGAAYMQIDLEHLQPSQYAGAPRSHEVFPSDVRADAWFDDVVVTQLPRLRLSIGQPAGIVPHNAVPIVAMHVMDLTGEPLRIELFAQDVAGNIVDRHTRTLEPGSDRGTWSPQLPGPGWYKVTLLVYSQTQELDHATTSMVWLSDLPPVPRHEPDRARLGVRATDPRASAVPEITQLVRAAGVGSFGVPAWWDGLDRDEIASLADRLRELSESLSRAWTDLRILMPELPRELSDAENLAPSDVPEGIATPSAPPFLDPLLEMLGPRVPGWRWGQAEESIDALARAAIVDESARAAAAAKVMTSLIPSPRLGAARDAMRGLAGWRPTEDVREVALGVPLWMRPGAIAEIASAWRDAMKTYGSGSGNLSILLVDDPERPTDARSKLRDLAVHTIEFWRAFGSADGPDAPSIEFPELWTWPADARERPEPTPELVAVRTLGAMLTGREVVGQVEPEPGVRCLILAPKPGRERTRIGGLVVWRESPGTGAHELPTSLRMTLGDGEVTLVDLFGGARVIPPTPGDPSLLPAHEIPLSDLPAFVEGIDVELVRFISGVRIDPDFVPTSGGTQQIELVVANPFNSRTLVEYRIVEPGGVNPETRERDRSWEIAPWKGNVSLAPGETTRIPTDVNIGPREPAGRRDFVIDMHVQADKDYGWVRVRTPVRLGLSNVTMNLTYRFVPTPEGPDLILEAQVSNTGDSSLTAELTAFAPGSSRQRSTITDLAPGHQTTRRFLYPGGAARIRGGRAEVSLILPDSTQRLNAATTVE